MTEQSGAHVDNTGATDEVTFVVRDEHGEVKHVKGPDPNVWGDPADRPVAASDIPPEEGPGYGEIWYEGTPDEIKGPDESWRERHDNPEGATSEG